MTMKRVSSIPENVAIKNVMSDADRDAMTEGVKQLMERMEKEKQDLSTTEYVLDGTDTISFPGTPYKLRANNEKVIVSIDVFKSGYECRDCKGTGKIHSMCSCEANSHPGLKYGQPELQTLYDSKALEFGVIEARSKLKCPDCQGDFESKRSSAVCPICKGNKAILIIPDSSKNLPTTGVVLSIGPQVPFRDAETTIYGYKRGDRILFGAYTGTMLPTKFGLAFKVIDADAAWAVVEGAEEMGAFDFVMHE